jgi:hypothetical protein
MTEGTNLGRTVLVHTAGSTTEAFVIRGLLQSAGIMSPGSVSTDPFPMREAPEGFHSPEIYVLESQAEEARRIIQEYLTGNEGPQLVDTEEDRDAT